LAMQAQMLQTM
jgi:hypothetical protein